MYEKNIQTPLSIRFEKLKLSKGWKRWSNGYCKKHAESSEGKSSPKNFLTNATKNER